MKIDKELKIAYQQFNAVIDLWQEKDRLVCALLEPVISSIHSVFLLNDISPKRLGAIKESLYIVDSINANIDRHGLEVNLEVETLWCYLHALYDFLLELNDEYYSEVDTDE
jgi:hypothetical protein